MSVLRVGHSPDADDAFMFYAFAVGKVTIEGFEIEQVMEEIESLNQRAMLGELEVTAISAAAYPHVAKEYRVMACGASMGRNYGPVLFAGRPLSLEDLEGKRIGIPGEYTTSHLLLRIYMERPFVPVFMHFDQVEHAITSGSVDAALVIHEGQITWQSQGYAKVLDLGEAWGEDTGLSIPLGLDVVHRRLGDGTAVRVAKAFEASIRHAMEHEEEAVEYALPFGRGIDRDTCRRFVRMYVNSDTVDMGEEGRAALETLYQRAHRRGFIETMPRLDIVGA